MEVLAHEFRLPVLSEVRSESNLPSLSHATLDLPDNCSSRTHEVFALFATQVTDELHILSKNISTLSPIDEIYHLYG